MTASRQFSLILIVLLLSGIGVAYLGHYQTTHQDEANRATAQTLVGKKWTLEGLTLARKPKNATRLKLVYYNPTSHEEEGEAEKIFFDTKVVKSLKLKLEDTIIFSLRATRSDKSDQKETRKNDEEVAQWLDPHVSRQQ